VATLWLIASPALAGNNSGQAFSIWPDTGQATCYDDAGNVLNPCPSPSQPFYGQDAQFNGPARSYTKLDASGNALPDSAPSWAMVLDNVTGLTWEAKQAKDNVQNYANPHDADNNYAWCDTNPNTNGGDPGDCGVYYYDTEEDFLALLNSGSGFGGHTDWRLPTLKEFATLSDFGRSAPTINLTYFPLTMTSSGYWSATSSAEYSRSRWIVMFGTPSLFTSGDFVRAVRGGQVQQENRFVVHNDGTVSDTATCLQWQQGTADPDHDGYPDIMNWPEALNYAEALHFAGYEDWRLPNLTELVTITDLSQYNPAIDTTIFPNTLSSEYWSSTTDLDYASGAYSLDFYNGSSGGGQYKGFNMYTRAVRSMQGGQCGFYYKQPRPEQTLDDNINGTGRKAVVITHGWNSDVNVWAVDMANKICGKIGGAVPTIYPLDGYKNRAPLYCSTADWDVFLVDWRSTAFAPTPKDARSAAGVRGKAIGQALAEKNYEHIHFLAHSAGSQLIDTAKSELIKHQPHPDLHLTFFDAFDHANYKASDTMYLSNYGYGATWVDNYVDMRSLIVNFENSTKNLMPAGYNVDVTLWDDRMWNGTYVSVDAVHAWPIDFYKQFTFTPMTTKMGFQLSQESGNDMTLSWFNTQKKDCILPFNTEGKAPYCVANKTVPDIPIATGVNYGVQRNVSVDRVENSSTGSVTLPPTILDPTRTTILNNAEYWSFLTGSPVWSKMDIDVKQPINALTFDYEFLSAAGAEGYVSVFVDNSAVGFIDERLEESGVHTSDRLYIGELAAGKHTLAVRVDPYTAVQSSVRLSNLKFVYVKRDQTFPWTMFLPAITHKAQ
jgi:hypothetical protein